MTKDIPKLGYKGTESCEIVLDNVRVPKENLLGGVEGKGMQQVLSALEWGRVNIAARSVGIAQRAHDEALAYAKQRKAFGQPIADFQAIQLKLGQRGDPGPGRAADGVLGGRRGPRGPGRRRRPAWRRSSAPRSRWRPSIDAMKVHGGYGYSTEYEVERLYRDAILMSIGEGTNDILRTVVAKSLLRGETVVR